MGRVSLDEVRLIQRIAREASSGSSFLERMNPLASSLSVLVPAQTVSCFVLDREGRPTHVVFWNGEQDTLLRYAHHYRHLDPMGRSIEQARGSPVSLSECMPSSTFGRTEFTSDFLKPLGVRWIMGLTQRLGEHDRVAIALQREGPLGDFTRRERELMQLVAPDLARAAHGAVLAERVALLAGPAAATTGAGGLLLDRQGELLHADDRGLALLKRLLAHDPRAMEALSDAARAGRGTRLLEAGDGLVRASLSPIEGPAGAPCALVVLEVLPGGSAEYFHAAAERVGLTEREREVAALAPEGLGNRGIAHRLQVSERAVRFHLSNVFRKARVPGRTELFHVLMGAVPPQG
ncbi:MAG: LuxR C-terminal-related transcriptional regulator [Planctomycetes bacterium]|nr:LuxR C-terminal-related transcriptional regulator [Planctomycetota bacterium]